MGGLIGGIRTGLQDGTLTGGHGGMWGRLAQGAFHAPSRDNFGGMRNNGFSIGGSMDHPGEKEQRAGLLQQGNAASGFAGVGEQGYGALTPELAAERERLRRIANGQESVSAIQLRQALDSNIAQQRAMAAGASPRDSSMASLLAMRNASNATAGLSGAQALAGIQERQGAAQALQDMLLRQRAQELQAALGSRSNAIQGFGGTTPGKSWWDKYGGAITSAATLAAMA